VIASTWTGKVPIAKAEDFYRHLVETGVADYRRQTGCVQIQLWRRNCGAWTQFLLSSIWESTEDIRRYAGDSPERAVLYPGDDAFGLIPDREVTHFDVLEIVQSGSG
jgi:quinol monooxygenase YgiN